MRHARPGPDQNVLTAILDALTQRDLDALVAFANRRLVHVGLVASSGEDLVQHAILRVLVGAKSRNRGRHPRSKDIVDPTTFAHYLRGVIISLVETQRAVLEHQFEHTECHDELGCEKLLGTPTSAETIDAHVAFRDLTNELFRHLKARSPARLQDIISLWHDEEFDCDQIPINGHHRRLRAEVRGLAAKVMKDITNDRPRCRTNSSTSKP